jgi:hypothetical protein
MMDLRVSWDIQQLYAMAVYVAVEKWLFGSLFSATGVARTAREILETTNQESILRNIPLSDITSKVFYDAAKEGDQGQ